MSATAPGSPVGVVTAVLGLEGHDAALDGGLPVGEAHDVDLGAAPRPARPDLLPPLLELLESGGSASAAVTSTTPGAAAARAASWRRPSSASISALGGRWPARPRARRRGRPPTPAAPRRASSSPASKPSCRSWSSSRAAASLLARPRACSSSSWVRAVRPAAIAVGDHGVDAGAVGQVVLGAARRARTASASARRASATAGSAWSARSLAELLDLVGRAAEVPQGGVVGLHLGSSSLAWRTSTSAPTSSTHARGACGARAGGLDGAADVRVDGGVDAAQVEAEVGGRRRPRRGRRARWRRPCATRLFGRISVTVPDRRADEHADGISDRRADRARQHDRDAEGGAGHAGDPHGLGGSARPLEVAVGGLHLLDGGGLGGLVAAEAAERHLHAAAPRRWPRPAGRGGATAWPGRAGPSSPTTRSDGAGSLATASACSRWSSASRSAWASTGVDERRPGRPGSGSGTAAARPRSRSSSRSAPPKRSIDGGASVGGVAPAGGQLRGAVGVGEQVAVGVDAAGARLEGGRLGAHALELGEHLRRTRGGRRRRGGAQLLRRARRARPRARRSACSSPRPPELLGDLLERGAGLAELRRLVVAGGWRRHAEVGRLHEHERAERLGGRPGCRREGAGEPSSSWRAVHRAVRPPSTFTRGPCRRGSAGWWPRCPPARAPRMLSASAWRSAAPRPPSTSSAGWNLTRSSSPAIFRTSSSNAPDSSSPRDIGTLGPTCSPDGPDGPCLADGRFPQMHLGRVGLWTFQLDLQPARRPRRRPPSSRSSATRAVAPRGGRPGAAREQRPAPRRHQHAWWSPPASPASGRRDAHDHGAGPARR